MYKKYIFFVVAIALFYSCKNKNVQTSLVDEHKKDSLERIKEAEEKERLRPRTAKDIKIEKDLAYNKHTLEDSYPYEDTTRIFQWEKIKEYLAKVENFVNEPATYAVLQNYKNKNREAPVVKNYKRNAYKRVADTLGVERYQSAPLYNLGETDAPIRYGRDGFLVKLLSSDSLAMVKVEGISFDGTYEVPKRYIKNIGDSAKFNHVVFVDVTNQNLCTLERTEKGWVVKSMNPATTGRHKPPFAQETPTGIFVLQEKKSKMYYHKDGTTTIEGYAPYANRFTNGAYIHGVPVNNPNGKIIEYSWSLGTIPRSHMCVRNASSHSKFVYDWSKSMNSLVIVID